jgi:hypothetical protein
MSDRRFRGVRSAILAPKRIGALRGSFCLVAHFAGWGFYLFIYFEEGTHLRADSVVVPSREPAREGACAQIDRTRNKRHVINDRR